MEQEIKVLQIVSIILIVLLVCLLVYLIIRKTVENRQNKKVIDKKKKLIGTVFEHLRDGKEIPKNIMQTRIDKQALEEVLTDFSERMEGEQEEKRLHELAAFYLRDSYVKELKARNWSSRMNVLYKIEDFHLHEMERHVISRLYNKNCTSDEKIQIYRILAAFQYEKIWSIINEDMELSEKNYRSILLRIKSAIFEEFIRPFYYCREELQLAILDVISMKRKVEYLVFLESVFEKYDGEIKLRALKAISSIGYVKNIEDYLFLAKSKVWEKRMMIAKLLGSSEEKYLPLLIMLLHDSSWWVRSQAAESIMSFKKGRVILLEIVKLSKDKFAQDMAREWLNKGVH
ncbi:HEAT repeat domain-containing protein [Niallia sp. JL1B1071]|uniref:HEAT repeat domain-containing protein n=1 Tax=Niallia tiangongensis TaxID=3237105 RepID=UPI0037DC2488